MGRKKRIILKALKVNENHTQTYTQSHVWPRANPHHGLLDFLLAKPEFRKRNKSCAIRSFVGWRVCVWLFFLLLLWYKLVTIIDQNAH